MGGGKSLDSLESLVSYASQVSAVSIPYVHNLSFPRAVCGELAAVGCPLDDRSPFPSRVPSGLTRSPSMEAPIADDSESLCLLTRQEIFHF